MSLSSPNGAPDPNDKAGWAAVIWNLFLSLEGHSGKLLMIPMVTSMITFIANIILDLSDDGVIDEQEFHNLLQGASSSQVVILALVMGLLRLRKK